MKTIIVSNNSLAAVLKESLADYINHPTYEAFYFEHPKHLAVAGQLAEYLQACEEQNPNEFYLYGSHKHLHYVVAAFLQSLQCHIKILLFDQNIICIVGRYRKYAYLVISQYR